MKLNFLLIFFIVFQSYAQQENATIAIKSNNSVTVELIGFEGLKEKSLMPLVEIQNNTIKIQKNYIGLALLRFSTRQIYPIYLNGKDLTITIKDVNTKPTFSNNKENEFLYQWLGSYLELGADKRLLNDSAGQLISNDLFINEIKQQQIVIDEKLIAKKEILNSIEYKGVKALLQARLLNESTGVISNLSDLTEKKIEYQKFISENFKYLYHSDMLISMCRQYLMMNEYVALQKDAMYLEINNDVKVWIDLLLPKIEAKETVAFMMNIFYNRGMVSMAGSILQNNRKILNRKVYRISYGVESIYKIGYQFQEIKVTDESNKINWDLSNYKDYKIISLVEGNDVVSKVSAIKLARDLNESLKEIPIIILPKNSLTTSHYSLNKAVDRTFYFFNNTNIVLNPSSNYFQFYLLNENNIVLMSSNNKNEILIELKRIKGIN